MKAMTFSVLVAVIALAWCGAAQAGTILLLSNTGWDGTYPTSGPRVNPDDQFVSWVTNTLGHTVVKQYVSTATSQAQVQGWINDAGADLVIIGPRIASANYTNAKGINQIATPMLALVGHAPRASQLAWVSGTTAADNNGYMDMTIVNASHPFFAGVTVGTSNRFFDYTNDGKGDTRALNQAGTTGNTIGFGTVLAKGAVQGWAGGEEGGARAEIIEWQSGVAGYNGSLSGLFGERRVFMAMTNWSRVNGADVSDFTHDVTATGKLVLANVINNMIPEPATMALLGLGLGAILRRRR